MPPTRTDALERIKACKHCDGEGWVCENHPDRPWNDTSPNGCLCGAGAPCPECQPCDGGTEPEMPPGTQIIMDRKHGYRH